MKAASLCSLLWKLSNFLVGRFIKPRQLTEGMVQQAVLLEKQENKTSKRKDNIDWKFVDGFMVSLEDAKHGRMRRVA